MALAKVVQRVSILGRSRKLSLARLEGIITRVGRREERYWRGNGGVGCEIEWRANARHLWSSSTASREVIGECGPDMFPGDMNIQRLVIRVAERLGLASQIDGILAQAEEIRERVAKLESIGLDPDLALLVWVDERGYDQDEFRHEVDVIWREMEAVRREDAWSAAAAGHAP